MASAPSTVAHLFWERAQASPDAVAFSYPVGGGWQESTWAQTRQLVEPLAAGLISLGIEPQDRVAIISETRIEWILADLAIMCAGGATTTVHPSTSAAGVAHILDDSGATVVFVESLEQVAKLRAIRAGIRKVRKVVLFDLDHPDPRVMTLEELLVSGDDVLAADPAAVVDRLAALRPDMLATIFYTSGTTRARSTTDTASLGVEHSHASWTHQAAAIAAEDLLGPEDLQLLWLPLSHPAGTLLLATQLACGFATAVDGDAGRIFDNLAQVRPTVMVVVSGGGSLDPDVVEHVALAGIPVLETYGLPEAAAAITLSRPDDNAPGTVGRALGATEVRIADDGEVLVRGPGVMLGYHDRPAQTASVLRDGWLCTGDIGRLDETGRLTITARNSARAFATGSDDDLGGGIDG